MFITIGVFQILIMILFISRVIKRENSAEMIVSKIIIFSITLSVVKYLVINYLFNPGYPNSTFLYAPHDRFKDFVNMINTCKNFDPYDLSNFLPSVYFPLANLFFSLFYKLSIQNMTISVIAYVVLCIVLVVILFNKIIKSNNKLILITSLVISYPVLFSLERLNLELVVFLLTMGFVYFYNKNQFFLAVFLLSIAISMKLYPVLFLILFIKDKNYKPIYFSAFVCISLSLISLFLFNGGLIVNMHKLLFNLTKFNDIYGGLEGLQHNSTIYGMIKIMAMAVYKFIFNFNVYSANIAANEILRFPYLIFVFIYFLFVSAYIIFIEKSLWKNVFLLTSLFILLPHVSFDYKLLHMIIPLLLFLNDSHRDKYFLHYVILFSLIMIPNSYFYFFVDISLAVFIYPCVMFLFTYFIFKENKSKILGFVNAI